MIISCSPTKPQLNVWSFWVNASDLYITPANMLALVAVRRQWFSVFYSSPWHSELNRKNSGVPVTCDCPLSSRFWWTSFMFLEDFAAAAELQWWMMFAWTSYDLKCMRILSRIGLMTVWRGITGWWWEKGSDSDTHPFTFNPSWRQLWQPGINRKPVALTRTHTHTHTHTLHSLSADTTLPSSVLK